MKRFAFIDVQNTETTTLKVLKFALDHEKLFSYLKDKWECEKIFFYPGIQHGDDTRGELFTKLSELSAIVRPKYFFTYKNEDKIAITNCPKCNTEITQRIEMGYSWKCNCDVELAADVLDHADKNTEIFLFSGDGDFEFLIQKVIAKGCKVSIVSSAKRVPKGPRYSTSRLSTKLRKLTQASGSPVKFIEIDNLKFQIKKEAN
ncbi:hypothetical protein A2643_04170 [Candidatus Nomurabacteria bacterium RIFCSPHIGHO2_01_FULL_39_220]|uniref:NYN domain-containing protein n=1 Tax=Candidatus Nomurabacteria bacterium RIFCSPLOWO2_02_FULL_40_67 TaxID=1801787 RepID=A0A1F6Y2N5_9BACT|nr:MAG: hypothetical protein UU01_C0019G0010 [Parcubacteria group bacterium GW2011_GWA2_40_37]KKS11299.1 MAG: hypothetical protein UU66_C0021G0004 [Parcubacteria group bacterium GW2011_GWB1_41_5]OGI62452.1 MAG: hypothetical protein A2W12_00105 [Candidatus Nomurabacteria bacterium RBG_16_40_11]OGI70712.1 MAG: hypothetical protein A2643_04170 [Candidatus Nomurabacteria bacterium RIFCSPHIGHO2_01_FULL_39_220]OGI72446.1 MAG: hypothetical protein A2W56_03670 [Candidatus Nomurabacteria bacterium RIFCS